MDEMEMEVERSEGNTEEVIEDNKEKVPIETTTVSQTASNPSISASDITDIISREQQQQQQRQLLTIGAPTGEEDSLSLHQMLSDVVEFKIKIALLKRKRR